MGRKMSVSLLLILLLTMMQYNSIAFRCPQSNKYSAIYPSGCFAQKDDTSSFLPFPGSDAVSIRQQQQGGRSQSSATSIETYIVQNLDSSNPREIWQWKKAKDLNEQQLQNAIMRNDNDYERRFKILEPFLLQDKVQLLNCNRQFFAALESGDMNRMQALWLESDDAICILNGSFDVIGGYKNIMQLMAKNTPFHRERFQLGKVSLHFYGRFAIVTSHCRSIAVVTAQRQGQEQRWHGSCQVTNMFVRPHNTDKYLLQAHVASPVYPQAEPTQEHRKVVHILRHSYQDPSRGSSLGRGGSKGGAESGESKEAMMLKQLLQSKLGPGVTVLGGSSSSSDGSDDDGKGGETDDELLYGADHALVFLSEDGDARLDTRTSSGPGAGRRRSTGGGGGDIRVGGAELLRNPAATSKKKSSRSDRRGYGEVDRDHEGDGTGEDEEDDFVIVPADGDDGTEPPEDIRKALIQSVQELRKNGLRDSQGRPVDSGMIVISSDGESDPVAQVIPIENGSDTGAESKGSRSRPSTPDAAATGGRRSIGELLAQAITSSLSKQLGGKGGTTAVGGRDKGALEVEVAVQEDNGGEGKGARRTGDSSSSSTGGKSGDDKATREGASKPVDPDPHSDPDPVALARSSLKNIASSTLGVVRWLHKQGRLSLVEKNVLSSDIIETMSSPNSAQAAGESGSFSGSSSSLGAFSMLHHQGRVLPLSKVEVAFCLLIVGDRPDVLVPLPHLRSPDIPLAQPTSMRILRERSSNIDAVAAAGGGGSDGADSSRSDSMRAVEALEGWLQRLDVAAIPAEDMDEFEQFCRRHAAHLLRADTDSISSRKLQSQ